MKPAKRLLIFLCLGVFNASAMVASSGVLPQDGSSSAARPIQTVDFCELVSHPEKYAREVVRTKAIYTESFESSGLSKADCPPGKNIQETYSGRSAVAEVKFDCSKGKVFDCMKMKQKLKQDLEGDTLDGASAEVVVIGWPETLSPERTQAGFNEAPIAFHIQEVESTSRVTPATPEP